LSTGDLEEAHVKRALIASAAETIVLASSEKLNAASKYVIAPITQISGLITEKAVPSSVVASFRKRGLTVTRA
jgi:DeoR/GlpR family transcriptional regulator of sugar metabolism